MGIMDVHFSELTKICKFFNEEMNRCARQKGPTGIHWEQCRPENCLVYVKVK